MLKKLKEVILKGNGIQKQQEDVLENALKEISFLKFQLAVSKQEVQEFKVELKNEQEEVKKLKIKIADQDKQIWRVQEYILNQDAAEVEVASVESEEEDCFEENGLYQFVKRTLSPIPEEPEEIESLSVTFSNV